MCAATMSSETAKLKQEPMRAESVVFGFPDKGKDVVGVWQVAFESTDFIAQFVRAGNDRAEQSIKLACEMTVIGNPGPGRLILRYDFGPHGIIYAKLYPDDLAIHGYEALSALWNAGLNDTSRYRVPEPLAFVPEHKLVIQRGVTGDALASALHGKTAIDLIEGSREAARWLSALHLSGVSYGKPENIWETFQIFRLMDKLVKAEAAHPDDRDLLCEACHLLKERFQNLPATRPVVQTHGRFRHEHVFISGDAVSVIDLDQSRPSDPAKDVAEFLHALRWEAFKIGFDLKRAEAACAAFLEEYVSRVPEAAPAIPACWSSFTLVTLLRYAKRTHTPADERQKQIEFLIGEMKSISEYKL